MIGLTLMTRGLGRAQRGPTLVAAWTLVLWASLPAAAQTLPSEPIVFADGTVTLGGDVSFAIAPQDTGFFNYSDYEHSTLRMLRLGVVASVKATEHFAVLGEVRSENGAHPEAYGLYLRVRPWSNRNFDILIGRVPPAFGGFSRRAYAADNPLIGYPVTYQYLTSLRADSLPANADELLRMRGRGWLSNFSVGNLAPDHGVPLVSGFRWDTGVQIHAANDLIEGTAAVTTGTLSNPLVRDDNNGPQFAGRVALHPLTGLVVGGSLARGPFVSQAAARAALGDGANDDFTQTAWGADVEYSRDYYLLRFETVVSHWMLPTLAAPVIRLPLESIGTSLEARYKIRPGLYAAARLDHVGFSQITGTLERNSWDAPVTRVEVGGGYSIQRNLVLKVSYQFNTRPGGRVHSLQLPAAQVVFWF